MGFCSLTLGILTALWQRPEISRVVLEHYAAWGVPLVAVRSPEDPAPTPDVAGVQYVDFPNDPLSDKWNAGMRKLKGCDAVMIVGSDDFISREHADKALALEGFSMARTENAIFFDTSTGKARRGKMSRMGAGRVLYRSALDRMGWQPWPPGLNRRLDGGMDKRMMRLWKQPRHEAKIDGPPVLCIKSAVNLWSYEHMMPWAPEAVTRAELDAIIRTHYPLAMATAKKTTKKEATEKAPNDKPKTVKMIASRNIPPAVAGTAKRVYRGQPFEVANAEAARNLESKGLAKKG